MLRDELHVGLVLGPGPATSVVLDRLRQNGAVDSQPGCDPPLNDPAVVAGAAAPSGAQPDGPHARRDGTDPYLPVRHRAAVRLRRGRHITLVGLMGAGKSSVGKILAAEIGWRFVDTDTQIEVLTGRSVRDLWREGGEAAYRHLETEAVVAAVSALEPSVLAAPAGVVDDDVASRAVTTRGVVAYLRAEVGTLIERIGSAPGHRPLLGDRPEEVLTQLFERRDAGYQRLADVVVDVEGREPAELAAAVRDAFRRGPAGPAS